MKKIKKGLLNNVVIVILLIVFVLAHSSLVFATTIATDASIDVKPNPVGVNQAVLVCFWIQPSPETAEIESGTWRDITIEVTEPDGNVVIFDGLITDDKGIGSVQYVPNMIGHHFFKMFFPGWSETGDDYTSSESNRETLIVQEDPVDYEPGDLKCEIPDGDETCRTRTCVWIIIIIILIVIIVILGVSLGRRMKKA